MPGGAPVRPVVGDFFNPIPSEGQLQEGVVGCALLLLGIPLGLGLAVVGVEVAARWVSERTALAGCTLRLILAAAAFVGLIAAFVLDQVASAAGLHFSSVVLLFLLAICVGLALVGCARALAKWA